MTVEAEITIDEQGIVRARVPGGHRPWGWFLEDDIGGNLRLGTELLETVAAVRAGAIGEWEGTGNAWTLYLTPTRARVESAFTDEQDEVPVGDFAGLLGRWVSHLEQARDA